MTAPELLSLIEERAPRLRKAGVLEIELDMDDAGVKLKLAPELPDILDDPKATKQSASSNPLYDARTYGLPDGAELPGFPPPIDDQNAEEDEHGRPVGADLDED